MMYKRTAMARSEGFCTRAEGGNLYIEGYFAVFGSRYELWDGAYETIDPGAFDGQTNGDVRALVNHDTTLVLGRTTAGTLSLRVDEEGALGQHHDQSTGSGRDESLRAREARRCESVLYRI